MSKTTTNTEYAAFVKLPSGSWRKIHAFYLKSEQRARLEIRSHKFLNRHLPEAEYKVMTRTVTITTEEWQEVKEETKA